MGDKRPKTSRRIGAQVRPKNAQPRGRRPGLPGFAAINLAQRIGRESRIGNPQSVAHFLLRPANHMDGLGGGGDAIRSFMRLSFTGRPRRQTIANGDGVFQPLGQRAIRLAKEWLHHRNAIEAKQAFIGVMQQFAQFR